METDRTKSDRRIFNPSHLPITFCAFKTLFMFEPIRNNLFTLKENNMKLFRNTPVFVTGILVAGMMSACQNENETSMLPQAPANTSDQNARIALAAGTLIKDGNTDLTYNSQTAKLSKETCPNAYNEFTYAPQLITAKGYKYGAPSTETKYTLDASGRCIQSVTNWKTYIYEYNSSGQLTKWYNKEQPKEAGVLLYLANSASDWNKSLAMATFYDSQGIKTKELTFGYGGAMGVADKHPLNPDVLPAGVSKYLSTFGIFNINLVQNIVEDKYLANGQKESSTKYLYSYTLNYSGKVSNVTVKKLNGALVSSTDRTYSKPTYQF